MVQQAPAGRIKRLSASRAGLLATLSYDRTLRIWDVERGALLSKTRIDPVPIELAWEGDTIVLGLPQELRRYDLRGRLLDRKEVATGAFLRSARGYLPEHLERDFQRNKYLFQRDPRTKVALTNVWLPLSAVSVDDARRVLVAREGQSDALLLWRLDESGTHEERFSRPGAATTWSTSPFALSPDGQRLASAFTYARGGRVELHSTEPPTETLEDRELPDSPSDVAYSPDGRTLTVVTRGGVYQFEAATLQPLWRHQRPVFDAVKGRMLDGSYDGLAYTQDSRRIIATRDTGVMEVLDAASGLLQGNLGSEVRAPRRLSFVDDDTLLMLAADHVTVWSVGEARPLAQLDLDGVEDAFLSHGDLVTVRRQGCAGDLRLYFDAWNGFDPPDELRRKFHERSLQCTKRPAPGERVARQHGGYPELLEIPSRDAQLQFQGIDPAAGWVLLDSLGEKAEVARQVVGLHDLSVSVLRTEREPIFQGEFRLEGGWVSAVLTLSMEDGSGVGIWDPRTGKLRAHVVRRDGPRTATVSTYAVARDGRSIAIAWGEQGSVFSVPEGAPLWTFEHDEPISALRIVGDVVVAGGRNGSVMARRDGFPAARAQVGGGAIEAIAMSPNQHLVALGDDEGAIWLWDRTREVVRGGIVEFMDDDYLVVTPGGAYAGTAEAATRVQWVFPDPVEPFGFEQFAAFRQPTLVSDRMAGKRASDIAAALHRPPQLSFVRQPSAVVPSDAMALRVHASGSTRVRRVRAYAEGRSVAEAAVCAASAEVELDVPLLPGPNRISVVAYDDDGFASNPLSLDVHSNQQAEAGDLWIVSIGVSRYRQLDEKGQLEFADDDAAAIAARFAETAGPGKYHRKLHQQLLLNRQVTRASVRTAIEALARMAPNDTAVLFVAGHGAKRSSDGNMVFLTSESSFAQQSLEETAISWDELAEPLTTIRGRVLLLVDACNSGHISQDLLVPNSDLAEALAGAERAGVIVFAASKGRQYSYEAGGPRGLLPERDPFEETRAGHGLFTQALLDSLDDGETDRNDDAVIHLSELIEEVTGRVHAVSRGRQTPWVARRELIGDFALAPAAPRSKRSR